MFMYAACEKKQQFHREVWSVAVCSWALQFFSRTVETSGS